MASHYVSAMEVFPAHAGVNPRTSAPSSFAAGIPRTRGGEPKANITAQARDTIFPAHEGVNLPRLPRRKRRWHIPRIRGGEPAHLDREFPLHAVFPAYAGVNPNGRA